MSTARKSDSASGWSITVTAETVSNPSWSEKRMTALKYVVHFVADIHQPLHAGYAEDRGGNQYQLQAFMRGSNLHALWDVGLIKNLDMSNEALTTRLLAKPVQAGVFNATSIGRSINSPSYSSSSALMVCPGAMRPRVRTSPDVPSDANRSAVILRE